MLFLETHVLFLKFIISTKGISINPNQIRSIKNSSKPNTIHVLAQSCLKWWSLTK